MYEIGGEVPGVGEMTHWGRDGGTRSQGGEMTGINMCDNNIFHFSLFKVGQPLYWPENQLLEKALSLEN